MADNEYNDEYQFSDLDTMDSNISADEEEIPADERVPERPPRQGKNIMRNALIVVILFVLAVLLYKFFGSYFSKKPTKTNEIPPITTTAQPQVQPQTPPITPVQPAQPAVPVQSPPPVVTQPTVDTTQVTQKLSALEMSQQNLRSEVNSLNNQLSGINSNMNDLSEKIANLNQMISVLATKVDQQSTQIAILTERTKPKPIAVKRVIVKPPLPIYFIQAVIPGRAWLIGPNGSTLTVREGTHIVGYGVVKLIDANQGRLLTTSGRVIRFSQQDN